jgi:cell wall-associated NlpC family hydrolase
MNPSNLCVPQNLVVCVLAALAFALAGCTSVAPDGQPTPTTSAALERALQPVRTKHAPDNHLDIFRVGAVPASGSLVLTGDVTSASAKADVLAAAQAAGFKVTDRIAVLPEGVLVNTPWALVCLSVANGREQPANTAEMGTQVLMGHPVRVWKRSKIWYLVQTADRYVCWMEKGSFQLCTAANVATWNQSPLLIVTVFEDRVLEQPQSGAQPITDVVLGGLVKRTGEEGDWYQVELPDHRVGWLPKQSAENYATWKQSRHATPESIERTARQLLGRPYLWGANSPKGLDCSGFNKFVFFLNGIDLDRNASHQSKQGVAVPLAANLGELKKGDLLFFGFRGTSRRPERVTHTGIYLGDKLFIHSSERVRINSLDPHSPIRDEQRIRMLLRARRILPR